MHNYVHIKNNNNIGIIRFYNGIYILINKTRIDSLNIITNKNVIYLMLNVLFNNWIFYFLFPAKQNNVLILYNGVCFFSVCNHILRQ